MAAAIDRIERQSDGQTQATTPMTSINLLTTRTERCTAVPYNEMEKLRNGAPQNGMMPEPPCPLTMALERSF